MKTKTKACKSPEFSMDSTMITWDNYLTPLSLPILSLSTFEATKKPKKYFMGEALDKASSDRKDCVKCGLFATCKNPFMEYFVPEGWTGEILAVGEAPGGHEDEESGTPFTGPAGQLLRKLEREAGWKIKDIAYVNALRCRPENNKTPNMAQIKACRPFLLYTIQLLAPRMIVAFGVTAIKSLLGSSKASVTQFRGKEIRIPELKGFSATATFHPASILHGNEGARASIVNDLKLLKKDTLANPDTDMPHSSKYVGVDTEYSPDGTLLTLGAGNWDMAKAVDMADNLAYQDMEDLQQAIEGSEIIQGHSVMGDIDHILRQYPQCVSDTQLEGKKVEDSLIMARMVDENKEKGAYGLENLACLELKMKEWKAETAKLLKETGDARDWTSDQRIERCRLDAWASHKLCEVYRTVLPPHLVEFTHRIAATLHRIGLAGSAVDMEIFHQLGAEWKAETTHLGDMITKFSHKMGMDEFTPSNPNDKRKLLYDFMNMPKTSFTEKGDQPSVDKYALKQMIEVVEAGVPERVSEKIVKGDFLNVLKSLQDYSKVSKLASTWYGSKSGRKSLIELIEGIKVDGEQVYPDGKGLLHNQIIPLGAKTGRRASGGEADVDLGQEEGRNSQNWPLPARRMIVSRWKGGKIAALDYHKLEPCIFAWYAGDKEMFYFFFEGAGYVGIGDLLFDTKIQEGSMEYKAIKVIHLGTQYNMGLEHLAKDLWFKLNVRFGSMFEEHREYVRNLRKGYFKLFPKMQGYIKRQKRRVLTFQRVVSATGRVRHLPTAGPGQDTFFWKKENQGVNQPTQSLASDVTGSAMVDYERDMLAWHGMGYKTWHLALLNTPWGLPASPIINEIHDELLLDMHPVTGKLDLDILIKAATEVKSLRLLCPSFDMPLKVDVTISDCWGGG